MDFILLENQTLLINTASNKPNIMGMANMSTTQIKVFRVETNKLASEKILM